MAAFFVLTAPMEENGADAIYGMYTNLKKLHTKVLEIMGIKPEKAAELVVAQLEDGKIVPIFTAKNFDKLMKCLEEETDKNILKEVIENTSTDFLIAFLREIISPEYEPEIEQRNRYCEVLNACEELLREEKNSLYVDIVKAGINLYSTGEY